MLKRHHPLWMSIHFMHPTSSRPRWPRPAAGSPTPGIPLGSQTVLLKGVNDDVETMKRLMHGLLRIRVRPYYLYQCDPISGSAHLRTPVAKGLEIIDGLRGHTTGYAVPTFVIDAPGGGGKIALRARHDRRPRRRRPAAAQLRGRDLALPRSWSRTRASRRIVASRCPRRSSRRSRHADRPDLRPAGRLPRQRLRRGGNGRVRPREHDRRDRGRAAHTRARDRADRPRARPVDRLLAGARWDLVFNIAEGLPASAASRRCRRCSRPARSRTPSRTRWSRALTLHKGMTKRVLRDLGIPTTDFRVVESDADAIAVDLPFPLFVKPVAEGTAKGIDGRSRVTNRRELVERCRALRERFAQPALVEPFLPGREFTTGIVGTGDGGARRRNARGRAARERRVARLQLRQQGELRRAREVPRGAGGLGCRAAPRSRWLPGAAWGAAMQGGSTCGSMPGASSRSSSSTRCPASTRSIRICRSCARPSASTTST